MPGTAEDHVAPVAVKVAGAPLDERLKASLAEVEVRSYVALPDMASLRIMDPLAELVDAAPFEPGTPLEIGFGGRDDTATTTLFKGEVVALEPEFGRDGCTIVVRAYDKSHRLSRTRRSRTFLDRTSDDIVKQVTQEAGLTAGSFDSAGAPHEYFLQSMETDFELVNRLAAMHDFEFVVEDGTCHFRKAGRTGAAAATLTWGKELLSFRPRVTGVQQYQKAVVRTWDPVGKQIATGEAGQTGDSVPGPVRNGHSQFVDDLSPGTLELANVAVPDQSSATTLAESALARTTAAHFEAEGLAEGDPRLQAGRTVALEKVRRFSGEYVLSSVVHRYRGAGGYRTTFTISGRSPRSVLDLVRERHAPDWGRQLVIGVVSNVDDPDGLGRVKVRFEALGDSIESQWARIALPHAGNDRGFFFLPQRDDEVIVGFEQGDTRRPYVLGSLFNGRDKPPDELLGEPAREGAVAMWTRSNALLKADKDLKITTGDKMVVEVAANQETTVQGRITQTANGNIAIESAGSVTVKGTGSVTVEAAGNLKLKGAMVDIEASGVVNVKGSMINLG
jgi:phage protein D